MVALVQSELKNVVSSACSKKWTQAVGVHVVMQRTCMILAVCLALPKQ